MATYTTNYNLKKPDSSDPFGDFRSDYNDNLDIIDANLGGGGGSSSLAGLSDVNLTTPTDGQVLTYDNVNSEWVNANPSGGSGHTIVDENDQIMPARTYLKFAGDAAVTDDSVNDETIVTVTGGGGASSLAGLSDVNLTTPSDGQVLAYDGNTGEWINANASGGGDSVSWNQIQASGTKIAEIDINGTTTDVYAPSGGGGGAFNYSLTEQVVGTWINSKPVYQKSLYSATGLSAHLVFAHGISNLDALVKAECILRADDDSYQIPAGTDQNNVEFEVTPTNIELWLNNDFLNVLGNGGYFITLQYTKTTD